MRLLLPLFLAACAGPASDPPAETERSDLIPLPPPPECLRDITPPVIELLQPIPEAINGPIDVVFRAVDRCSLVHQQEVAPLPTSLECDLEDVCTARLDPPEGYHLVRVRAVDQDGNAARLDRPLLVDRTPPRVRFAGERWNGATLPHGEMIDLVTLAWDSASGLVSDEVFLDGQRVEEQRLIWAGDLQPGRHEVEARAIDRAGNVTRVFGSFTLRPPPAQIRDLQALGDLLVSTQLAGDLDDAWGAVGLVSEWITLSWARADPDCAGQVADLMDARGHRNAAILDLAKGAASSAVAHLRSAVLSLKLASWDGDVWSAVEDLPGMEDIREIRQAVIHHEGAWLDHWVMVDGRIGRVDGWTDDGVWTDWHLFVLDLVKAWLLEFAQDAACRLLMHGRPNAVEPLCPGTPHDPLHLSARCRLNQIRTVVRRRERAALHRLLPRAACDVYRAFERGAGRRVEPPALHCPEAGELVLAPSQLGPDVAPEDGIPDFVSCGGVIHCPNTLPPVPAHLPPGQGGSCDGDRFEGPEGGC